MINIVYTFTKLHDRRIPKVRVGVGVGPVEFKFNRQPALGSRTCSLLYSIVILPSITFEHAANTLMHSFKEILLLFLGQNKSSCFIRHVSLQLFDCMNYTYHV